MLAEALRSGGNGRFKVAAQAIIFSKKFGLTDDRKAVVSQACSIQ